MRPHDLEDVILMASLAVTCAGLAHSCALAVPLNGTRSESTIEPPPVAARVAPDFVHEIWSFYASLTNVQFELNVWMGSSTRDKAVYEARFSVRRSKPWRMTVKKCFSEQAQLCVTCDGDRLYTLALPANVYVVQEIKQLEPVTLYRWDSIWDASAMTPFVPEWERVLLAQLLADRGSWPAAVHQPVDLGVEREGDRTLHHVRFFTDRSGVMRHDLWVEDGDRPLIYRVEIHYLMPPGVPAVGPHAETPSNLATPAPAKVLVFEFSGWVIEPEFPDSAFSFTPPADAKQVPSWKALSEESPEAQ